MTMKTTKTKTKIRRRTSCQKNRQKNRMTRSLRRRTRCRWRRWLPSTKEMHACQVSFGFLDIFCCAPDHES